MENKKILLIGGGGHCFSALDILKEDDKTAICVVEKDYVDIKNFPYKIDLFATDNELENLFNLGWKNAIVVVGSVGDTTIRKKLTYNLEQLGFNLVNVISKTAIISNTAKIGKNNFIGKRAILNANVSIGNGCIINTSSTVEHDCKIGNFVHLASGSTICGGCEVGNDSHIGAGSVIIQGIKIGKNVIVGAGSVVVKDIPDNVVAYGNPCKVVRKI